MTLIVILSRSTPYGVTYQNHNTQPFSVWLCLDTSYYQARNGDFDPIRCLCLLSHTYHIPRRSPPAATFPPPQNDACLPAASHLPCPSPPCQHHPLGTHRPRFKLEGYRWGFERNMAAWPRHTGRMASHLLAYVCPNLVTKRSSKSMYDTLHGTLIDIV